MHRQGRGQNATQPGSVRAASKEQQCLGAYKARTLKWQGIILTRRPVSLCRGNLGWFGGTLAAAGWGFCTAERSRSNWQGVICLSVRLGALSWPSSRGSHNSRLLQTCEPSLLSYSTSNFTRNR